MLIGVLLAAAVLAGIPLLVVGIGAAAMLGPVAALAAIALITTIDRLSRRQGREDAEAVLLRMLGAELASGASVRHGLAAVAGQHPALRPAARLAVAGVPMPQVAARLVAALPVNGRLLAAAITLGSRTGSGLTGLVQRLGERAERDAELRRELAAATAQARISALVVGIAPLAFTGLLVASGAVPAPWQAAGLLAVVVACGLALQAAGFVVIVLLLRRHAR